MIFREFYPRGLTALDDLDELILGTRPTMSHMSARLEVATLLSTMRLRCLAPVGEMAGRPRDAA